MGLDRFDPGWLYLIAGTAMLGATTLIPAMAQLDEVRWHRERALQVEAHRLERLQRHEAYLAGLDAGDRDLVRSLAALQLNKTTVDRSPVLVEPIRADADASVFPSLEPAELVLVERQKHPSLLERMTMDDRIRPWLVAGAALSIFVGILPRATGYRGSCPSASTSLERPGSPTPASSRPSTPRSSAAPPDR